MPPLAAGDEPLVIALVVALVLVGIVLGFFAPPFGFVPAAVGLVLLVLYLVGIGRRATARPE